MSDKKTAAKPQKPRAKKEPKEAKEQPSTLYWRVRDQERFQLHTRSGLHMLQEMKKPLSALVDLESLAEAHPEIYRKVCEKLDYGAISAYIDFLCKPDEPGEEQ